MSMSRRMNVQQSQELLKFFDEFSKENETQQVSVSPKRADPSELNEIHKNNPIQYYNPQVEQALSKGYQINTIYDLAYLQYPWMQDSGLAAQLLKVDAPLLSSTTAAYVAVHGARAFEQVINESNIVGLLPKFPYTQGGYRALTAAGQTTATGGQSENATLPDSTKPTLQNVDVDIKEHVTTLDSSSRERFLSSIPNANAWSAPGGDGMEALREYMGREHVKLLSRQLMADNDTVVADNVETIDRAVGSFEEVDGNAGIDAGDLDFYGIDRDAGSTVFDAYVSENDGTNRPLTDSIIRSLVENAAPYWDGVNMRGDLNFSGVNNKIWVTGHDTASVIEQIYQGSNRYQNLGARAVKTVNGISTYNTGAEVGFMVNTLYGMPMFRVDDTPADGISRLYLLDLDHMGLSWGKTTMYQEAGFTTGTAILLDRLGDRGMYYSSLELWVDRFQGHAKARDLT